MKDLITEARELCAKATPGRWSRHDVADYAEIHNGDTWGKTLNPIALVGYTEDADFIARSRTLVLELCDALENANAEIDRLSRLAMMQDGEIGDRDREIERLREAVSRYCRNDCFRDACAGNEDVGIPDCPLTKYNPPLPAPPEKEGEK